jgi:hypothetical protein
MGKLALKDQLAGVVPRQRQEHVRVNVRHGKEEKGSRCALN